MIFFSKYWFIDETQIKKGRKPTKLPIKKYLLNKISLRVYNLGSNDIKGTAIKNVLSINANPIQRPKSMR